MGCRVKRHTHPKEEVRQGVAVGRKMRAATLPHHPALKGGGGGVANGSARPSPREVGHSAVPMPGFPLTAGTGACVFNFRSEPEAPR